MTNKEYIANELLKAQDILSKLKREYRKHTDFDYELERHIEVAKTVLNIEWDKYVNN